MNYDYSVSANAQGPVPTIIALILIVLIIVANWKIFEKAGEAGWKAIIPFYNLYTKYKMFWGNGWLFLLTIIPVVNVIVGIIVNHKMSKAFGHGLGFTLGLVFFPYIFCMILGFNGDEYLGPQ